MVLQVNGSRSEMVDLYSKKPATKADDKKADAKDKEKSTISSSSSSEGYSIMGCIAAPFVFVGNILWRCYRALFCCDYAGEGSKVEEKKGEKKADEKKAEGADKKKTKDVEKKEGSDVEKTASDEEDTKPKTKKKTEA